MSSITLHSQSFRPAPPWSTGGAARGLADAMTELAALLRGLTGTAASDLRERAIAHRASNPSFAADLQAAADRYDTVVERA